MGVFFATHSIFAEFAYFRLLLIKIFSAQILESLIFMLLKLRAKVTMFLKQVYVRFTELIYAEMMWVRRISWSFNAFRFNFVSKSMETLICKEWIDCSRLLRHAFVYQNCSAKKSGKCNNFLERNLEIVPSRGFSLNLLHLNFYVNFNSWWLRSFTSNLASYFNSSEKIVQKCRSMQ